jgi:hypothetical protein
MNQRTFELVYSRQVMNRDRFAASIIEKSLMIFVIDPSRRHPGETFSDSRLLQERIVPGQ